MRMNFWIILKRGQAPKNIFICLVHSQVLADARCLQVLFLPLHSIVCVYCNQVGTLPEPLFQKCPGGEKGSSRQQKTMQNTSKGERPWYLRPVDFILRILLKSSWNPSGTTDPRQIPQTPGFHLVSLVAIKLEPFLNHCSRKGSSRQQNTMQNTSKRPWYLRPVDFILRVFFKSSWSPSGTTDPRQTRQTPGFYLVSRVAIKLEPFLNHCSRNAPGKKKAAQGSKKQCRIPAKGKDLGTSDLWISYCVFSSNQVGAPSEPRIHDKHVRPQVFIL